LPKAIDRRAGPLRRDLLIELALQQQPVIFSGLFDNQPIRAISTVAELPGPWADTPVRPKEPAERINYPGRDFPDTTLLRFLTERQPGFVFSKMPLAATGGPIALPPTLVELGAPTNHFSYYMGNPGAFTHLHFDANCRHNMHYQLLGRKRFFLFPEHRSRYLAPQQQSSRIFLERMSAGERLHFADYAGGYVCTLEPGESLFIPALMWHYVEYAEPAISISYRFGHSRYTNRLHQAIGGLHSTVEFQHLAMGWLDDTSVTPAYESAYAQVLAAIGAKYEFARVQRKLEELCQQLCPAKVECLYANWQDHSLAVG
jgi:lysine-specific demethylase 8